MPQTASVATDLQGAAGMNIDRAWKKYGRGRDDVIVSYMEGGINWRIDTSCELKDRAFLNRGELPYPVDQNGKTKAQLKAAGQVFTHPDDLHDLNDDGTFNVEDTSMTPASPQAT